MSSNDIPIDPALFASTIDPALVSPDQDDSMRFTPSEEAVSRLSLPLSRSNSHKLNKNTSFKDLLQQSHSQKLFANTLFASSHYTDAISKYEQALSLCPNYLDYEIAILKSNIAACFIKLEDWRAAVDSSTEALDRLERILQLPSSSSSSKGKEKEKEKEEEEGHDDDGKVVDITAEGGGEQEEEERLAALQKRDKQKEDGERIRAKALLRRARAKSELGGWANLQAAHEGIPSSPFFPFYNPTFNDKP